MARQVILRGGKRVAPSLPEDIPELDEDQYAAGESMAERGAKLLLSDPGAGKTLTAIHGLLVAQPEKTLLVVPSIAIRTWYLWVARAYQEAGLGCQIEVLASSKARIHPKTTHLIVSHGLLSVSAAALKATLLEYSADALIVDESDAFTGWTSSRTKTLFGDDFRRGLALYPTWAWFLTGTPIPRYQDGLYPVLRSRFSARLAWYQVEAPEQFLETFCRKRVVKYGNMRIPKVTVCGSKHEAEMQELLFGTEKEKADPKFNAPAVRLKLDARKPNIQSITLPVKFSAEFKVLESEIAKAGISASPDEDFATIDPRMSTAFRMMGEEVAPYVAEYLHKKLLHKRDSGDNRGILALHWHSKAGETVTGLLQNYGWKVGQINGRTTRDNNDRMEDWFNAGRIDFCVGQIAAMGVALNLQKNCNTVVFAEDTFSHARNLQAYQRVWRRGQTSVVDVEYIRTENYLSDMKPAASSKKEKSAAIALGDVKV